MRANFWLAEESRRIDYDRLMIKKQVSANRQAGAIPYTIYDGRVEVMLLTSRDTQRWIIPKGNIEPGQTALEAAAAEALEEAGVQGVFDTDMPIGFYNYRKTLKTGESRPTVVEVYVLRVTAILKKWREQKKRERVWLPLAEALAVIEEPGAIPLLQRLQALENTLIEYAKQRAAARKK